MPTVDAGPEDNQCSDLTEQDDQEDQMVSSLLKYFDLESLLVEQRVDTNFEVAPPSKCGSRQKTFPASDFEPEADSGYDSQRGDNEDEGEENGIEELNNLESASEDPESNVRRSGRARRGQGGRSARDAKLGEMFFENFTRKRSSSLVNEDFLDGEADMRNTLKGPSTKVCLFLNRSINHTDFADFEQKSRTNRQVSKNADPVPAASGARALVRCYLNDY